MKDNILKSNTFKNTNITKIKGLEMDIYPTGGQYFIQIERNSHYLNMSYDYTTKQFIIGRHILEALDKLFTAEEKAIIYNFIDDIVKIYEEVSIQVDKDIDMLLKGGE